tara:strand:- start:349 stop:978 length:630 start_codon:yes stop_codon:yes gene_type:complete
MDKFDLKKYLAEGKLHEIVVEPTHTINVDISVVDGHAIVSSEIEDKMYELGHSQNEYGVWLDGDGEEVEIVHDYIESGEKGTYNGRTGEFTHELGSNVYVDPEHISSINEESIQEDGEFQREYQNVQVTIRELEENRVKLTRLYAQLANNNEYSRKIYDAMDAMIDQGRDNIASNWKEDLYKYDEEHSYLMSQINDALEKDKLLREKIK